MQIISKLETRLATWYGKLPHLPQTWRIWLADNSWWLVVAYVLLVGLGLLALLQVALVGGLVLGFALGVFGAVIGVLLFIAMIAWFGLTIFTIVLMVLAVRPLRAKQKRGWTLLFAVLLLWVAVTIVRALWDGQTTGVTSGLLGAVLSGYVLFEIRGYFGATPVDKARKKSTAHSTELKASTNKKA